jgi:hypothetical protein
MADRCEHCMVRMDGLETHADDCPVRGPEIQAENEYLRDQLDTYKRILWLVASKHEFVVVPHRDLITVPDDDKLELLMYFDPAVDGTVIKAKLISAGERK